MQIAHGYQDGGVPKQLFHRDDIRAPIQYLSHLPHVRVDAAGIIWLRFGAIGGSKSLLSARAREEIFAKSSSLALKAAIGFG